MLPDAVARGSQADTKGMARMSACFTRLFSVLGYLASCAVSLRAGALEPQPRLGAHLPPRPRAHRSGFLAR